MEMRVSIRPQDSGYMNHRHLRANGRRAVVYFNGEHETGAITADDEAGMIVRYIKDTDGEILVDLDRECPMDEVVHGKVEIEVVEEMVL
jgi:hypothetical protein